MENVINSQMDSKTEKRPLCKSATDEQNEPSQKRRRVEEANAQQPEQPMDHDEIREAEDYEVEQYHQQYLLQQEQYIKQQKQYQESSTQGMLNLDNGTTLCRSSSGTRILLQLLRDQINDQRASDLANSGQHQPVVSPRNINPQYKTFSGGHCESSDDDMYFE